MDAFKKLRAEPCKLIVNIFANIRNDSLAQYADKVKSQRTKESESKPNDHAEFKIRPHFIHIAQGIACAIRRDRAVTTKPAIDDNAKSFSDSQVQKRG